VYNLQLRKGGLLISKEWNSEIHDFTEEEIIEEEIQYYLDDSICLEKGVALRDIFLLISKNIQLFSAVTGCPYLDEMIEDAFKPPKRNTNKTEISALSLERKAFLENLDNESMLHFHFEFYGIGEQNASIEFAPIYELTLYPVILNDKLNIEVQDSEEVILSAKVLFTLVEVIKGIISELSFAGSPEIKAYALEELKTRAESVETYKAITMEELEQKLEEQMDLGKKPCRICGEDSRSASFNKPSNVCDKCFKNVKGN
jgi:hypothetical protein